MNCWSFRNRVADWMSDRLSPESAKAMAAHMQCCHSCAHAAQRETALRAAWREAAADVPRIDVWHQLGSRLGDFAPPSRPTHPARRWAWGAAALAAVALWYGALNPPETPTRGQGAAAKTGFVAAPAAVTPSATSLVYLTLADVPRVDPAVDDPARTSVEQIWTRLNNTAAGGAESP